MPDPIAARLAALTRLAADLLSPVTPRAVAPLDDEAAGFVIEHQAPAVELPPLPAEPAAWLARLRLLQGLPFYYLVPDAALLPPESMRWFTLDERWLDALVDGALSAGAASRRDRLLLQAAAADVRRAVAAAGPDLRTAAGFLLRAAVVAGLPRLAVTAYVVEPDGSLRTLPALRLEKVAPGVLLALFPEMPHKVDLDTPGEALHIARMQPAVTARAFDDAAAEDAAGGADGAAAFTAGAAFSTGAAGGEGAAFAASFNIVTRDPPPLPAGPPSDEPLARDMPVLDVAAMAGQLGAGATSADLAAKLLAQHLAAAPQGLRLEL